MAEIGEQAQDFSIPDQNGNGTRLSGFPGKRVVLSFHPLAWTSICARQMKALEANREAFDALGAVALGISVDSVPCKRGVGGEPRHQEDPASCGFLAPRRRSADV